MSLITETNQQYYQGAQGFRGDNATVAFKTTFDTSLILGSFDPNNINYALNNFKLYTSSTGSTWFLLRVYNNFYSCR